MKKLYVDFLKRWIEKYKDCSPLSYEYYIMYLQIFNLLREFKHKFKECIIIGDGKDLSLTRYISLTHLPMKILSIDSRLGINLDLGKNVTLMPCNFMQCDIPKRKKYVIFNIHSHCPIDEIIDRLMLVSPDCKYTIYHKQCCGYHKLGTSDFKSYYISGLLSETDYKHLYVFTNK